MQDIILHLGAHRTASTHVQGVIGKNQPLLARAGIHAPEQKLLHRALTKGLNGRLPVSARTFERFVQECGVEAAETLVISDENLLGFLNSIFTHGAFYPDTRRRLNRLRQILPTAPRRIVFGIRPYDTFFSSAYGRWLAPTRSVIARDALEELVLSLKRGWHDVASDIAAAFPDSELVLSEYSPDPAYGQAQLSRILGPLAADLEFNPDYRWNRSMSARQTMLYEQAVLEGNEEKAAEIRAWRRFKQPPLIEDFWSTATQSTLQSRYKDDRAALRRQFPAFVTAADFAKQDAP